MAVTNPFSITYGSRSVGGSNGTYQLHGPYVIEKHYDAFRLVFDVIVVGTSHADLKTQSDNLEIDFRKRLTHGQTLVINIGGSTWTYTVEGQSQHRQNGQSGHGQGLQPSLHSIDRS
jgi:hypothetical protein